MKELPVGTVSMVFSDIEGSTQLLTRLGERYADTLDAQRSLLRRVWTRWRGIEMGTEGDSFYVVFDNAHDAVFAVVQAQRDLATYPWPAGNEVRVRMGVHTGVPTLHGDSYVGMDVHRAARIAAAAHGGQVVVSEATSMLVARDLPDGARLVGLGVHRLKDIAEPERLVQVAIDGLPSEFPPLRTLGNASSLPIAPTPLIGRDSELAELTHLLRSPQVRLVTLTGPGGSGKTRLALAIAESRAAALDDVYFVSLASVRGEVGMWAAVAEVMGLPHPTGGRSEVLAAVQSRRCLIVLDNLEQLVGASEVVAAMLEHAARLSIVATSRGPLHVAGEHEHPVPPLGLPRDSRLDVVGAAGAVRLFVQHATMVRPSFELTSENAAAVAAICQRVDGLPLGVELAAVRIRLLTPSALLVRLDDTMRLRNPDASRPTRQQTLRGAIAWSYELLDDAQQLFFRSLGVFSGSADLDAIEAIVGSDDCLELVADLQDVSLVVIEDTYDGDPRVRLLETVRDFARSRLVEADEMDSACCKHAEYYAVLAEELVNGRLWGSGYRLAMALESLEHPNFIAALEWALDERRPPASTGDRLSIGVRLCASLRYAWIFRGGYVDETRQWMIRAEAAGAPDSPALASVLCGLATIEGERMEPDLDFAHGHLDHAIGILRGLGDWSGLIESLTSKCLLLTREQKYDEARTVAVEAISLAEANDPAQLIFPLIGLANLQTECADAEGAAASYQRAGDVCRETGWYRGVATMAISRAQSLVSLGRLSEAMAAVNEAVEQLVELDDPMVTSMTVATAAYVFAERHDHERAIRLRGAAEAIAQRAGVEPGEGDDAYGDAFVAARVALTPKHWAAEYEAGRDQSLTETLDDIRLVEQLH